MNTLHKCGFIVIISALEVYYENALYKFTFDI